MGNKLTAAINNDDIDTIDTLLNNNYKIKHDHILLAINNHKVKILNKLLNKYTIKQNNKFAGTAIVKGYHDIVEILLKRGCENKYLLLYPPSNNRNEIFDLLIEYGADINATGSYDPNEYRYTSLKIKYNNMSVIGHAIINKNYEYIKKLVNLKVDLLKSFTIEEPCGYDKHSGISNVKWLKTEKNIIDICDDISKKLIQDLYNEQVNNKINSI